MFMGLFEPRTRQVTRQEASASRQAAIKGGESGLFSAVLGSTMGRFQANSAILARLCPRVAQLIVIAGACLPNLLFAAQHVPPSIVTQPSSLAIPVGQNASFSVTAAGSAPLGYQW